VPEDDTALVEPDSVAAKIFALRPHMCRWPLGDPGRLDFQFCCEPVIDVGTSYCPRHGAIATLPRIVKAPKSCPTARPDPVSELAELESAPIEALGSVPTRVPEMGPVIALARSLVRFSGPRLLGGGIGPRRPACAIEGGRFFDDARSLCCRPGALEFAPGEGFGDLRMVALEAPDDTFGRGTAERR
jgi:hypothetical protein